MIGEEQLARDIEALKTTVDTNLDVVVSTRAPSATALSTATWTNTKAGYIDAAISTRTGSDVWTATKAGYLDIGISTRTGSDVWTAAKAGYLDVAVTTRTGSDVWTGTKAGYIDQSISTVESDVWSYGTRTLTDLGSDVAGDVWSYPTRSLTTINLAASDILVDVAHKIDGELISTDLDAQVSTRALETGGNVSTILTAVNAMPDLTRYSGTLTADGTEQTLKEVTPSASMIAYRGIIDLSDMEAADTVVVAEYYKVKSGGDYLKLDARSFTGLQTAYPAVDITPRMPNRYGLKITVTQTVSDSGGFKAFDWELFTGE